MSLLSQEKCCLSDSKAERGKMFEENLSFWDLKTSIPSLKSGVEHSHTPAGFVITDLWPIVQLKPIIERQKKQKSHN